MVARASSPRCHAPSEGVGAATLREGPCARSVECRRQAWHVGGVTGAHTIFFDECGFTGEDLVNTSQPVFVLASHDLPENVCRELKARHFDGVQAAELKHTNLQRRPRQQKMVLALLRDLATAYVGRVKCSVVHKRYALVAWMVEILVEPVTYEHGIDLYERGGNIATANMLFYTLPVFGSEGFFDRLLRSFQALIRGPRTEEAFDSFFRPLLLEGHPPDLKECLEPLLSPLLHGPSILRGLSRHALDVSLSCTLDLAARWRHEYPLPTPLRVTHDASSKMAENRSIWDALVDPALPSLKTGYDRRTRTYPIAVAETQLADSSDSLGIQIADVVAGACARGFGTAAGSAPDDYSKELRALLSTHRSAFVADALWPTTAVSAEDLGTNGPKYGDIVDDTVRILKAAGVKANRD